MALAVINTHGRSQGYGTPADPGVLRTLCELEWPTFQVNWPSEGSLDLSLLFAVRSVVYGVPHLNQRVYIDVWVDIVSDKASYIKKCQQLKAGEMYARVGRKTILVAAPKPQGKSIPHTSREEKKRALSQEKPKPRLYPVLPGDNDDIADELFNPPPYPRGSPQDPEPRVPEPGPDVRVQRPPHTRGGTPYQPPVGPDSSVPLLPLREVLPQPGAPQGPPRMVYVPFSTSDLYNWKNQNPPFSEDPQKLISLLETIFRTHQPTWDDCQQILQTLFSSEERERIHREAAKIILGDVEGDSHTRRNELEEQLPTSPPRWNPNMDAGMTALRHYHQSLLRGLRAAAKKPTNLAKVNATIQGKDESPAAFLERLLEAYRIYTPLEPNNENNRRMVNMAFVSQSAPDIRKKLQKLEGFEGKAIIELIEIAQKVYQNREDPIREQTKQLSRILLATPEKQQNKVKKRAKKLPLHRDQCAYCKERGHWKSECKRRISPQEPMLTLTVEGKPVEFLVDTGATFSVLKKSDGELTSQKTSIIGATGKPESYPWTRARITDLGKGTIKHSFLVMPDCPYPLLGRDLLQKLQATISFGDEGTILRLGKQPSQSIMVTVPISEEYLLYASQEKPESPSIQMQELLTQIPGVWAEQNPPGLASHQPPIIVQLLSSASPVRVKQYPIPQKAKIGIAKHIKRLRETGILRPCQSSWNTPLLPVRKPGTEDYRPVQDLREVNSRIETVHPTVPNPYTLLSLLPPDRTYYSVLDLKDAFFTLPLAPQSQLIFAFEWTDPEGGFSGQLTWTCLPQGFKNSPTLFDEALSQDLLGFRESQPQVTLLQYVDDLLLAAATAEECLETTKALLRELERMGYRVSAKKAQICIRRATYLGYQLQGGKRSLSASRIEAIQNIPTPTTKKQVREFLGAVGYCRLWILGFAEIAKPLYTSTGGKSTDLIWTDQEEKAFRALKQALILAPALALPDITKPFQLFVAEKGGIAKGVLTQTLGPWKRLTAYLSKRLDPVAAGWPSCMRAIAATALLVKEAQKLTLGQDLQIIGGHTTEALLRTPPDRWISNACLTQYQVLLLNPPHVTFSKSTALNSATLLPDANQDGLLHDCIELLDTLSAGRPDLKDTPLTNSDYELYTDGSSYLKNGQQYAGVAVTTEHQVIWAQALPQGTSAQKAGLIALTQALHWAKGKRVNIYTDSRYAFATALVHGALYQERGLLTSAGKEIKNKQEILALLSAIWLPKEIAIIHCRGHKKGPDSTHKGNNLADETARRVATEEVQPFKILPLLPCRTLPTSPNYNKEEQELGAKLHCVKGEGDWKKLPNGHLLLPKALGITLVQDLHRSTHLGISKLISLINKHFYVPDLRTIVTSEVTHCLPCTQVNPGPSVSKNIGIRNWGQEPGEHWELDFTEVG
ncbi:uncharacterized protein LOC118643095 [Molossus molossus]|uniref:uncharacterized protein LOC118643095 n=1 Tax=Molossus molossus TaxID=27622 RepID=UPI001747302B|nr:uncharacterized protein LOC118643095 [Molossus molossus]